MLLGEKKELLERNKKKVKREEGRGEKFRPRNYLGISCPIIASLIYFGFVCLVLSCLVVSFVACLVLSCLVLTGLVLSGLSLSLVWSCLIWF